MSSEIFGAALGRPVSLAMLGMAQKRNVDGAALRIQPTPAETARIVRGLTESDLKRRRVLVLSGFDAAGEHYQDVVRTEGLLSSVQARIFIMVINPLSVQTAWPGQSDGQPAEASKQSPDAVYQRGLPADRVNVRAAQRNPARRGVQPC